MLKFNIKNHDKRNKKKEYFKKSMGLVSLMGWQRVGNKMITHAECFLKQNAIVRKLIKRIKLSAMFPYYLYIEKVKKESRNNNL